jgi:hypothetical protein
VGVLAFVSFVGLTRGKERGLRTKCQSQLQQFGTLLEKYSKDNDGMLPEGRGAIWPWDISTNLTADLEARGATRDMFYCPGNPELNDDRHWNLGASRVISYGMMFRRTGMVPPNLRQTRLHGRDSTNSAPAEMIFDATACVDEDFTKIQGLYRDKSNHLRGNKPLGGNILFTDLHVQWRDFKEMQPRFTSVGTAGDVMWYF